MALHFRKDSPNGITAINPDGPNDIVEHITKRRGQKTVFTSVSERSNAVNRFEGVLYQTDSNNIEADLHEFFSHQDLMAYLLAQMRSSSRGDRILAQRAYQYASMAAEALVRWQFNVASLSRSSRISHCSRLMQGYFSRA